MSSTGSRRRLRASGSRTGRAPAGDGARGLRCEGARRRADHDRRRRHAVPPLRRRGSRRRRRGDARSRRIRAVSTTWSAPRTRRCRRSQRQFHAWCAPFRSSMSRDAPATSRERRFPASAQSVSWLEGDDFLRRRCTPLSGVVDERQRARPGLTASVGGQRDEPRAPVARSESRIAGSAAAVRRHEPGEL